MKKQSLSILAAICIGLSTASWAEEAASPIQNPHYGPYSQAIGGTAHWSVSQNYMSLDVEDTSRLMEAMQNPGVTNSWLYAPRSLQPWFAVIDYQQTGHVTDEEKLDPVAIMEQMKKGTEATNALRRQKGWSEFHLIGWQSEPHYEPDTKRLSWATLGEIDNGQVVNYTTKVLSRTGVATVTLVTDPAHLAASIADLKSQLDSFSFDAGEKYSEFREGDKVAEYGLTGLIVGGAAAAAVKTGAWKWLVGILAAGWKVIAGIAVAALAGLRSLFTRKRA